MSAGSLHFMRVILRATGIQPVDGNTHCIKTSRHVTSPSPRPQGARRTDTKNDF